MSPVPYEVREVIVTARPVAGVRARVPRGRVAQYYLLHATDVDARP
jgi:hypothetical protein